MESIEDLLVVLTDRYFVERAAQHAGQLESMLGFYLFNMEEVGFVGDDHHGHFVPRMQLPYVLVEVTKQFITFVVSDRKGYHHGVCPPNASV